MKLIKIAAAALITLSSFAAQAGLMYIDGGANLPVPTNNYFKNVLNPQTYNIGGNLKANQTESLFLSFEAIPSPPVVAPSHTARLTPWVN
jgi:hypothetical protein